MSLWHTIIMTFMFISMVLSDKYVGFVPVDTKGSDEGSGLYLKEAGEYKRRCLSNIYNTFIFLQIFNQINCRKVGPKDFNVFENFFHNFYFLLIWVGTFAF